MIKRSFFLLFFVFIFTYAFATSDVNEKNDFEQQAPSLNRDLVGLRKKLNQKFSQATDLFNTHADKSEYEALLKETKHLKEKILFLEEEWKEKYNNDGTTEEGKYNFWDQGETTLSTLLMEYGSIEYLYVIPYEIGSLKLNLYSSIPLPQESWDEMIKSILFHNGIGIKQISPYLRQLYILKHDPGHVQAISHRYEDLIHLPDQTYVFHVFSPEVDQIKASQTFFERFSDPKQTHIQIVGTKIILVGTKENIIKLLQLYSSVWENKQNKVVKTLVLKKIQAVEAEKVLQSFFQESAKIRPTMYSSSFEELQIIPLSHSNQIVIVGAIDLVNKAQSIIDDLENQIEQPDEMTIYWYTCKHSDPDDVAKILSKIYNTLAHTNLEAKANSQDKQPLKESVDALRQPEGSFYKPVLPVAPAMVEPGKVGPYHSVESYGNFIVDQKTGSILMAVRKEDLEKIKKLLKKLDVPKKMVQIEVLLVEKKLHDTRHGGINLLKIGTGHHLRETGVSFDVNNAKRKGLLDFILSRPKDKLPSIDFMMSFLLAQDDIRIKASPSVTAINQTPATISVVEELSINNGAIQLDTSNGVTVEKSFTRAQFGITIVFTPTIHLPDEEDEDDRCYVTLHTNVTFDTTQTSEHDRPPVTRRHIENEVRIADGETVILGGLRRLSDEDSSEKIPFLGDIPKIGKLFGTTKQSDSTTEMFIFITPKIIHDPINDLRKTRQQFLEKRPGDIPEFLEKMEEAKNLEKKKLFEDSIRIFSP